VTSDSPIADLTDSANVPQFGYESPATVTSRQINDLLGTRQFIDSVIEQAGLTTAVENGALTRDDVASSVGASPAGDNLVRVASTTSQPEMSQRLAAGTVAAFINQIVDSDSGNISVRIDVYNDQLQEAKDRLAAAQKALDDFVEANPSPTDGQPRPDTEAATFTRLNDNVDAASSQVDNIQASLDNATLTSELTLTDVQQRLSLIDEPEVPTVPEPRMRKAAMTAVMFGAFGAVISIAVVALAAALDRTVRVPADITERFRLDVLAVLPASRR
jgi:capsular polysaccharide biosynthesis protein